jgi:hypothetical protein
MERKVSMNILQKLEMLLAKVEALHDELLDLIDEIESDEIDSTDDIDEDVIDEDIKIGLSD